MVFDQWFSFINSIVSNPTEYVSFELLPKYIYYLTLFLHVAAYQRYVPEKFKTMRIFAKSMKYVAWGHGISVFVMLNWFHTITPASPLSEEDNPTTTTTTTTFVDTDPLSALHYFALSALVIILWDFGVVYSANITFLININMHHVAVFIALAYQPTESPTRAWRNMTFYAWIWMIHAFSILNEIILPLFGIHLKEGERLGWLEAIRHVYAMGSVYYFYLYFLGEGQPGLGWNYQTLAAGLMVSGRLLVNDNWKMVAWLRRVELPGYCLVLVHYCFFREDKYLERSVAMMLTLVICYVTYRVFFSRISPKPAQYRGPFCVESNSDPEILNLIQTFKRNMEEEFPGDALDISSGGAFSSPEFIGKWFDSQEKGIWKEKWPLHRAVAHGDKAAVLKLLSDHEDKPYEFVNQKMTDWHDGRALGWAVHLTRFSLIIRLLEAGADPYMMFHGNTDIIDRYLQCNSKATERKNVVFREFFEKLDELCLKASPPVDPVWSDLSIFERVVKIVKNM